MTFDSAAYWRERGKAYERKFRPERYRLQEERLTQLLQGLPFRSVLDVGCGFGRIGEIVMELRPDAEYVGVDVSPDQLAGARRRLGPKPQLIVGDIRKLGPRTFDLVLAIEVLMHQPPTEVAVVIAALRRTATRHLVTCDWSRTVGRPIGAPDFLHDYRALLGPEAIETEVGAQSIWYLRA
jgi:SAM-dependent methyltransferase